MKEMKRILSLFLCLIMLVGLLPTYAMAEETGERKQSAIAIADAVAAEPTGEASTEPTQAPSEPVERTSEAVTEDQAAETLSAEGTTYVLAGSDFQAKAGHDAGATIVNGLLAKITVDYPTMNGFLFAGDYDVNYSDSAGGKAKLQETVQAAYGTGMDEIYVQGNHDSNSLVGSTLTSSGENDAENYGVFVINEKDYMWHNDDETTIKNTAANLKTYLNAKRNAGYTKPIFVVSHLPLHYSMRTRSGGSDGMHANYIFDVLNEAGNAGLNIIFLFGHDHSHGWDDYLGGAAIFLTKGDKINIAQNSTTVFEEETLAFTYMNPGYVGYYGDSYTSNVDKTLTMTTFAITDTDVTISRYDSNGTHDLKSAGVYNVEYPDAAYYSADTTTVGTPQVLTLNKTITPAGEEIEAPDSGSTATERTYTRVTSTSDLVSGGKYLIIHNGQNDFMIPVITSNDTRIGYDLVTGPSGLGNDTITGDYQEYEWTFTSVSGGWNIGSAAGSMYFEAAGNRVAAQLGTTAHTMVIGGSANNFTFTNATYGNGNYVLNYNSTGDLINGYASGAAPFYIYRMTDEGSSTPTVDTTGGNWVTISKPTGAGTRHVYELDTNGVDTGVEYLIVANGYEKALSAAASSNNAVDVDVEGNYAYADSDTYGWTFTQDGYTGSVYYIRLNNSTYLRLNNGALGSRNNTNSDSRWTVSSNGNGSYDIVRGDYDLRWSNSNGVFQASSSNEGPVRLFKYLRTETITAQPGLYGKVSGELTYNVAIGTSAADAVKAVKDGIDILYHTGDANAAQTFPDDGEGMTWTLDPSYDGVTPGEYAVTIAYNGVTLGIAKVVVPSVAVEGYSVDPLIGTVNKGAAQAAQVGAYVYVNLANGNFYTVPVTVAMLTKADGSAVSTGEPGTYTDLTLTYNGQVITKNFTLNVVAKTGNDYPEYPDEGAVKVSKTATGVNFQSTGVAQVEVSASGVPLKKGADVIVMLDLSSSMTSNSVTVDGESMTRLAVLEESLQSLLTQLKADGSDGKPMDIRIAVADFNRYYTDSSSPYYINEKDHLTDGSIRTNTDGTNRVYTGSNALDAGAFVDVHTLATHAFDGLETKSGTNYDYAFDAVYQLGEAITAQNATTGEERDLFVIFMSDGAPFQFNYFSAQSGSSTNTTNARYWNNWLQGTMEDSMFDSNARNDYYNEDGKHWMAEAIKGDPATTYPVIRKNDASDSDGDTWVNVNGLGATMYSIGFCLAVDKEITVASMDTVIRNIASNEHYYYRADTAETLSHAFSEIGGHIAYAADNARFVDQMGDDFDLQMTPIVDYNGDPVLDAEGNAILPSIQIITYDIWTRADYEADKCTLDQIGVRKGTSTVQETITFTSTRNTDENGEFTGYTLTGVYSDQVDGGKTNILADGTKEGYVKGVIYAKTFLYNTNATDVVIDGVVIPTATGTTNVLPSETFYWNMGTVKTTELALRYYVYLTGSMEGTRPAGSYPTNEYAILYYDNYLEHPCYKETVSPIVAWKSANVSYAFYLVNEEGQIIVNQTTGETGTFANKVAVTRPVVYDEIMLNSGEDIPALEVKAVSDDVLPKYYELYDEGAVYEVQINSDFTGSWVITNGGVSVNSTYVTQYKIDDPSAYTNALTTSSTDKNDYTHTVVWFAVVWKLQAHPDTVVIDYGLPVDISVLANDMFGDHGKLAGIGAYDATDANNNNVEDMLEISGGGSLLSGFGTEYEGKYGTAKADTSTGKVRYTVNTMSMDSYEKFAYAVNYTGSANAGYYYDTVTVIPATTIYYEDNFLTFNKYNADGTNAGTWDVEGSTVEGAVQDEDRPGKYSLTDANNIYGYDHVNLGMSTYSLGSARKVHVDANSYATATFTFMGTGFDVISMTSNTTGTIAVQVNDANGVSVAKKIVNTYYGYTGEEHVFTYTYTNDAWTSVDNGVPTEQTVYTSAEEVAAMKAKPTEGDTYTALANAWIHTPDVDKAMYQVPVLQIEDLTYGTYTVTITATYGEFFDKTTADGYDLYLDAIRIYDPANDGAADSDSVIEDAYKADGEGWPSYIELRNKLISTVTLGNTDTSTKIDGMVFIDGDAEVGDAQLADYISYGPNNEVYLAPGQSVAFILNAPDNVANIHIGVKSADRKTGTYTFTNIARQADTDNKVEAGDYYNAKTATINTTTDMYYDLTGWQNDIIVITNTGDIYDTDGIISLTNIKSTYKSDPNETVNEGGTGEEPVNVEDTADTVAVAYVAEAVYAAVESNETSIYMTPAAATLTLRSLNTMYTENEEEETEPTEPEDTTPETTVPEDTTPETTVPEETEPERPERPGKPDHEDDRPGQGNRPGQNNRPGQGNRPSVHDRPGHKGFYMGVPVRGNQVRH